MLCMALQGSKLYTKFKKEGDGDEKFAQLQIVNQSRNHNYSNWKYCLTSFDQIVRRIGAITTKRRNHHIAS